MMQYTNRYITTDTKWELEERSEGFCETCGLLFPYILQIHHIIPIEYGGQNVLENLLHICPNCHVAIHTVLKINKMDKASQKRYWKQIKSLSSIDLENAILTLLHIQKKFLVRLYVKST